MEAPLLSTLSDLLSHGLSADSQVFDFMEAVFGNMDSEEYAATLARVLKDEDEPEHEQLKEMLLFPDEALRMAVEPSLEKAKLSPADLDDLAGDLAGALQAVPVAVPGTQTVLQLPFERDAAKLFVSRLHADVHLDERLIASADEHLPPETATAVKVRLRSSHLPINEGLVLFLRRVLTTMGNEDTFLADFSSLLVILAEDDHGRDVYELLKEKKIAAVDQLRLKKDQEERLAKSNTETMLMAGERILAFDEDTLREGIAVIDRVSLAVFGVAVETGEDIPARDLGVFDPDTDVDRLTGLFNPEE